MVDSFDLVIAGVRIFDGREVLPGLRHIGIAGDRIAAVSAEPLAGARVIDGAGRWALPGLIDVHVHLFDFHGIVDPATMAAFLTDELPRRLNAFLAHGVTTVKSVGDPQEQILDVRRRLEAGKIAGPRLLATGLGITAPDGHPGATVYGRNPWYRALATGEVSTAADARALVRHLAEAGVDAIKLLSQGGCRCAGAEPYIWRSKMFGNEVTIFRLKPAVLRAAIAEAHGQGLRATVHTVEQEPAIAALEAGADGLEHGVVKEAITDDRLIDLMRARGASYVPTLWVYDSEITRANLARVAAAGIPIALGTDSFSGLGAFGRNTLDEAELMVGAGLSPLAVLRSATRDAARLLARDDIGLISPSKAADLVVVGENPTADIGALRHPALVIKGGRVVHSDRERG